MTQLFQRPVARLAAMAVVMAIGAISVLLLLPGILPAAGQSFEGVKFPADILSMVGMLGGGHHEERERPDSKVVVLKDDTLEDFIKQEGAALVMYYVPWCHWSRELLGNFQIAADLLHHQLTHVKLGKIDVSINRKAQETRSIMAYPTLRMYLDGEEHDYTGGRSHSQIVKWVADFLETEISITSPEHLELTLQVHKNEVIVIGCFDPSSNHTKNSRGETILASDTDASKADTPQASFIKLSRHFKHMFFADVSDAEVISALVEKHGLPPKLSPPFLAVINPYSGDRVSEIVGTNIFAPIYANEPPVIPFYGSLSDYNATLHFLATYQFPKVIPFTQNTVSDAFSDGRPLFALFVDRDNPEVSNHIAAINQAASAFRSQMLFVVSYLKGVLDTRLAAMIGTQNEQSPTFRIFTLNPVGHHSWSPLLKFAPPESIRQSMDPNQIFQFVSDYFADKLKPHLESEPEPEEQDNTGPVRRLVATTFDKEVRRTPKDVLVVFSAPWCGHCRKLEPTLLDIGRKLRKVPTVLVASIDATRNEVPGVSFTGYPTILLFTSAEKYHPVLYRGDRSLEHMIKWISENAHHKFDAEAVLQDADGDDDEPLLESEQQVDQSGRTAEL